MTPEVREINLTFKESEQAVSKGLIKLRNRVFNAYWGKVPDSESFPSGSGTQIKGVRLPRIGITGEHGWDTIDDGLCSTNACAEKTPEVIHNGFEDYFFSIIRRTIRTDWLCLSSMVFRDMPEEEIDHFEQGMREATRHVWDEVYRSRYLHMTGNHIVPMVTAADVAADGCPVVEVCDDAALRCDGWMFERRLREDGTWGEIDESHVRVRVDPTELNLIGELSLDMLDEAALTLEYDDETMPMLQSEGIDLFDVVLAHNKMGTKFAETEDIQMSQAMSLGGFEASKLKRLLGTKAVFRNRYSVRYDIHAARFYPDFVYNADTLPSFGAFNLANPQTWPRMKRQFAFIPQLITTRTDGTGGAPGGAGIKYVTNPLYGRAPFGISTIFSPNVISGLQFPENSGVRSAQKKGVGNQLGYAGSATWYNPDWEQNENREFGFWKMRYGIGIKPNRPEFGYSWFHRLDHTVVLVPQCCALPTEACVDEVSPYCYQGMAGEFVALEGTRGANKMTISQAYA